jgi:hypothetical protein
MAIHLCNLCNDVNSIKLLGSCWVDAKPIVEEKAQAELLRFK